MKGILTALCFAAMLARSPGAGAHPGAGQALDVLGKLISEHPRAQSLYIERGALLSHEGQYALALDDLRMAESLGDPVAVAFDLGVLLYRRQEYAAARAALGRYLERHSRHAESLLYRARCWSAEQRIDEALADYAQHFRLAPRPNPGDYLAAARLLAGSPRNDSDAALQLLDAATKRIGPALPLQQQAVELELRRGRTDEALRRWRSLQWTMLDSPEWRFGMAKLLLLDGQAAEAESLLAATQLELAGMRPTPARTRLRDRVRELLDGIGDGSGARSEKSARNHPATY